MLSSVPGESVRDRIIRAVIVAGTVGGIVAGVVVTGRVVMRDHQSQAVMTMLGTFLLSTLLTVSFGILITAFVAPLVYALFEKLKWRRIYHYLIAGAIAVPIIAQIVQFCIGNDNNLLAARYIDGWAFLACGGVPAAWAFWKIAVYPKIIKDGEQAANAGS